MGIEVLLLIPFSQKFKRLGKAEKMIFYYLIVSIIFAAGSFVSGMVFRLNNMLFVTCMKLLQFMVLSVFYFYILKNAYTRRLITGLSGLVLLVFILDLALWEGIKQFNSIFASLQTLVLICYGIMFFLQLLRDEELVARSINMNDVPLFWFNAGLFIYLCCSFIVSLTMNYMQSNLVQTETTRSVTVISRSLNMISGIIQLILFYIGIVKVKKERTYELS